MRRVRASDAGAIAAAVGASLDYLRPWMPWATPEAADRRNQLARVAEADQNWESGLGYVYSVLTADRGTLVGEVALHRRPADGSIEMGYWIAASQAGLGYGTSAGRALTLVALALPGVTGSRSSATRRTPRAPRSRANSATAWIGSRSDGRRRQGRAAGS